MQLSQNSTRGDQIWAILFGELRGAFEHDSINPTMVNEQRSPGNEDGDPDQATWEDERSWRDPSAHKLRGIVIRWLDGTTDKQAEVRYVSSPELITSDYIIPA
jgi:U3 small nucleolar RNA-associated protein 20